MRTIRVRAEFEDPTMPAQDTFVRVELRGGLTNKAAVEIIRDTVNYVYETMGDLLGCPVEVTDEDLVEMHDDIETLMGKNGRPE